MSENTNNAFLKVEDLVVEYFTDDNVVHAVNAVSLIIDPSEPKQTVGIGIIDLRGFCKPFNGFFIIQLFGPSHAGVEIPKHYPGEGGIVPGLDRFQQPFLSPVVIPQLVHEHAAQVCAGLHLAGFCRFQIIRFRFFIIPYLVVIITAQAGIRAGVARFRSTGEQSKPFLFILSALQISV